MVGFRAMEQTRRGFLAWAGGALTAAVAAAAAPALIVSEPLTAKKLQRARAELARWEGDTIALTWYDEEPGEDLYGRGPLFDPELLDATREYHRVMSEAIARRMDDAILRAAGLL